jgi:hypothetical protein
MSILDQSPRRLSRAVPAAAIAGVSLTMARTVSRDRAAAPPRLLRDGRITTAGYAWDTEHEGLPPGRETELLAEAGGLLQGRFLLTPGPATCPSLEQRLVAIGLADQAGAALASARLAVPRQSRATA